MMTLLRSSALLTGIVLLAGCAQSKSGSNPGPKERGPLPLKYAGGPTTAAITEQDLMSRLYRYADDSMQGRRAGTESGVKAVEYIASEFRRLGLQPAGDSGGYLQDIQYRQGKVPTYNVVAILPGSDPVLRNQYVAIGAHNDHEGVGRAIVDHDSIRTVVMLKSGQRIARMIPDSVKGAERAKMTDELKVKVFAHVLDSLRKLNPTPRRDSIFNGADDDGSGTVALLELAEAFANAPVKPKRSILFVSHAAEERGLLGSAFFTKAPTVPRDSIIAQINVDMIGRGTAEDLPQGGPRHLDLVGSRRLSTEFGALVDAVNAKQKNPFVLDYRYDPEGHPEQIYCRSDHWNYAKYNIPVVFFFTGLHIDYHQLTDEPQYIDYEKMTRITRYIYDIAVETANLPKKPTVDKPMAPGARCR